MLRSARKVLSNVLHPSEASWLRYPLHFISSHLLSRKNRNSTIQFARRSSELLMALIFGTFRRNQSLPRPRYREGVTLSPDLTSKYFANVH